MADVPPVPVAICRSDFNKFVIMLQQSMVVRLEFWVFALILTSEVYAAPVGNTSV